MELDLEVIVNLQLLLAALSVNKTNQVSFVFYAHFQVSPDQNVFIWVGVSLTVASLTSSAWCNSHAISSVKPSLFLPVKQATWFSFLSLHFVHAFTLALAIPKGNYLSTYLYLLVKFVLHKPKTVFVRFINIYEVSTCQVFCYALPYWIFLPKRLVDCLTPSRQVLSKSL